MNEENHEMEEQQIKEEPRPELSANLELPEKMKLLLKFQQ
jgi:hypothetical protein